MARRFHALLCMIPFLGCHIGNAEETSRPATPNTTPLFYESRCPIEIDLTLGFDDFRGIYTGRNPNSFGALTALNLTVPIARSFSTQLAGSYGLYNWAGTSSSLFKNSKSLQQQGFITLAGSYQTPRSCGWNAGVAYDWMLNKNFGYFSEDPFFDQIRGQVGYLIKGGNELGVWGTYGFRTVHEHALHLKFKGISQVNVFWSHYFKTHGYTMLWAGTPYQRGLLFESGRAGRFILGAQFSIPVTRSLSLEGRASYMSPRGGSGTARSKNYGSDVFIGITYSAGKRRIAKSPYMTLANNTNFMADTNRNF
jgi:hypothetical protein